MPSLKIIRKRIASVKSTQKITRAMKMVAGARLNRAQQRIVALRPYAQKTGEMLRSVAGSMTADASEGSSEVGTQAQGGGHPLLVRRAEKRALIVVITRDRGLCGGINTNVGKAVEVQWKAKEADGTTVRFATIGRKGREYVARRGGQVIHDFPKPYEKLDLDRARVIAQHLAGLYARGEFDSITLVYNEFKSAISQQVVVSPLLPLAPTAGGAVEADAAGFIFEPNPDALLVRLLPMYMEITMLRAMLDSQASFFGAQMTAMDAATTNAKDMIQRLTLVYNRARQAAITKELMEIIGGAEALKE
jgi:F-type H+-transporting ATPase subunit gamma